MNKSLLALAALSGLSLLSPRLAHADASCNAIMNSHISWDQKNGGYTAYFQDLQYVYVKDDGSWSEWSSGMLSWNSITGAGARLVSRNNYPLSQLFSDRYNGAQPFNVNSADKTLVTGIDVNGNITLYNQTWNFTSTYNATCHGRTLIANVPDGTLVMTIADASQDLIR